MKTIHTFLLLLGLAGIPGTVSLAQADAAVSPVAAGNNTNLVQLNFRSAPLELMLERLAESAGFTVVLEAHPKGTADLWSAEPVTRDEAFNLVNTVLIRNGYAAIRRGRTLTIVDREQVKTRSIPVRLGSDPAAMPDTDEVVTQIIPVRYTEVAQLLKDLQGLVSTKAVMTADESANAIVITDVQSSIRRIAEVIQAVDQGAEDSTVVRVFRLKNADASETADQLSQLFPDTSSSQTDQNAPQFGGGPGGPPGGGPGFGGPGGPGGMDFPGGGSGSGSSSGSQRLKKGARVLAVADPRTGSLVVSAPQALISQVEAVVARLDESPARKQTVHVYKLKNGSPQQVAKALRTLFQKDTSTTGAGSSASSSTQTDPLEMRSNNQSQSQQTSTRSGFGGGSSGGQGGFSGGSGQ